MSDKNRAPKANPHQKIKALIGVPLLGYKGTRARSHKRSAPYIFFSLIVLLACTACEPPQRLNITEILAYDFCAALEKPVSWVSIEDFNDIRGVTLVGGAMTKPEQASAYLALYNGQHPTAGFGFELTHATLNDGLLALALEWREPLPGDVVAQVLSTPCLILAMTPAELVTRVDVSLNATQFGTLAILSLAQ